MNFVSECNRRRPACRGSVCEAGSRAGGSYIPQQSAVLMTVAWKQAAEARMYVVVGGVASRCCWNIDLARSW